MNKLTPVTLACLFSLVAVACKPATPVEPPVAPAAAPAAPAAVAAPTIATAAVTDTSSTAAPRFDQKAFSGTFKGTLPCVDCDGIDTTLALRPDGSYLLSEAYRGKPGAAKMDGTWTVEAGDKHIRLDPNSKAEDDRLFAISSNEQIDALGKDGQPAAGSKGLHRDGAAH